MGDRKRERGAGRERGGRKRERGGAKREREEGGQEGGGQGEREINLILTSIQLCSVISGRRGGGGGGDTQRGEEGR